MDNKLTPDYILIPAFLVSIFFSSIKSLQEYCHYLK